MESIVKHISHYPLKKYQKGQIILCQGITPTCCFVVKTGFVKTYSIANNGDEKPISFDASTDLFPIAWAFGKSKTSNFYHQAHTDCEVYQIPRVDFLKIVETKPKLLYRFMHYMLDRCLDYQAHVRSLEQAKAADKILHALNFLTYRFGKKVARSRVRMLLPLTQQDLANFLGLTRETTGTQLKKLEKRGVIHYSRQNYLIDKEKLESLIESGSV